MKNFRYLGFLLLVGCIFNGTGWGNNPTSESSSSATTNYLISDSSTIDNITSSTTTDNSSISTTNDFSTSSTSTSTSTGMIISSSSSSSGFDLSSSSSSSTGMPIEPCGNCELEIEEECDFCQYLKLDQIQSYCATLENPRIQACTIGFYNTPGFMSSTPLPGMKTPQYDQEEADILCKIYMHSIAAVATDYTINNIGYSPNKTYLSIKNHQGKGIELKSATQYYPVQPLYFFEYDDIGFNQNLDPVFYATVCK